MATGDDARAAAEKKARRGKARKLRGIIRTIGKLLLLHRQSIERLHVPGGMPDRGRTLKLKLKLLYPRSRARADAPLRGCARVRGRAYR